MPIYAIALCYPLCRGWTPATPTAGEHHCRGCRRSAHDAGANRAPAPVCPSWRDRDRPEPDRHGANATPSDTPRGE